MRYAKEFLAGWNAMDFNGPMANTAYLDLRARKLVAPFVELPMKVRSGPE